MTYADKARAHAIGEARKLFHGAPLPTARSPISHYMRQCGFDRVADTIDSGHLRLPMREITNFERHLHGDSFVVAVCPVMIMPVTLNDGAFTAVELTFLDRSEADGLHRTCARRGVDDPAPLKQLPTKTTLGSVAGGSIHLYTPDNPKRLVMAETIETLLAEMTNNFQRDTAYWCGVSLAKMAGSVGIGIDGKRHHDIPNLETVAFVPPEWCMGFVLLAGRDKKNATTEKKLVRCARRAIALCPGVRAHIIWPDRTEKIIMPEGVEA